MKILVIGSGGREHALVWKIAQSKLADKLFCAPANAGIIKQAECLDIKADDIPALAGFARQEKIDLTVVGPEAPLASGIADEFEKYNLRIFGPIRRAAQLEASKVFAKELMAKYKVPTADFCVFDDPALAKKHLSQRAMPCVVKADGLAAGKGVIICKSTAEAEEAIDSIMRDRAFGSAGDRIIVEDCLEGQEASIIVFTDSRQVLPLASSQDHKRVFDGDSGPNTGGMGAYSPAPIVNQGLFEAILERIIYPIIDALAKEGIDYKGVLYAGIMITRQGPKVLEFNVRFGDPETQAIMPRFNSDLIEAMLAVAQGKLSKFIRQGGISWDKRACVCVVCASGGYPGKYEKGSRIFGLEEAAKMQDIVVFHAGTKKATRSPGHQVTSIVTDGGRVLGVTGLGEGIKEAIDRTYQAVEKIHFTGMHFRRDIGQKAI